MNFDQFLIPITAVISGVSTLIVSNFLNRKKDKFDLSEKLIQNLWKEIGRLSTQLDLLKEKEAQSYAREQELLGKIELLIKENTKQSQEIEQLRKELQILKDEKKRTSKNV